MSVTRIAISLDPALARRIKRAARKQGTSAWLADLARRELNAREMLGVIEGWEAEHGKITEAQLEAARQERRKRRSR